MPCGAIFELDVKKERIAELEEETLVPGFWDNQAKATAVQKEQGRLQNMIDNGEESQASLEEAELLHELAIEEHDPATEKEAATILSDLDQRVDSSELERMFSGEHDTNNAMLTIHAGAGGTEAQDWVSILLRMYLRWADSSGFKTRTLDLLPGDEAGIKSVTIMIEGEYVYGYLRSEMGIHRVVRISPFDASGRRHTSFASVFIVPELDDDINVEINDKDLRIDTYRASGAGGQHVNKTSSAIRITHLPTNIVVQCQNERSQHRNKDTAMKMPKTQLYKHEEELQKEEQQDLHGDKKDIGWGRQIRSYVMQSYRLIKDHHTTF